MPPRRAVKTRNEVLKRLREILHVRQSLGRLTNLRRCLNERIFTAAVGEVSRGGLEREGVPVDFVADPARLGALIRGLAASSDRIRAKSGEGRKHHL